MHKIAIVIAIMVVAIGLAQAQVHIDSLDGRTGAASDFGEVVLAPPNTPPASSVSTLSIETNSTTFRYDSKAVVNRQLSSLGGYRISVETSGNPLVIFYSDDPKRPNWGVAAYNWERQYWTWTNKPFDPARVDLRQLFHQISLSSAELNRKTPKHLTTLGNAHLESTPYNMASDGDFKDFWRYLAASGVSHEAKNAYLHRANNPAKRGAIFKSSKLPFRWMEDAELGFQRLRMLQTPRKYTNKLRNVRQTWTTGGMQYYFELAKGKRIPTGRLQPYYLFRYNDPVPLTVVEIVPPDGTRSESLEGAALYGEIEAHLEAYFKKDFQVEGTQVVLDYQKLLEGGPKHWSKWLVFRDNLKKCCHDKRGRDRLYVYYFTDTDAFSKIDRKLSHPTKFGATIANWERKKDTFIHEFGHALGLYHHFDHTPNAGQADAHLSGPCIMNYRNPHRTTAFCPLCRYALGLPPNVDQH
jgi:hypothetical protein